MSLEHPKAHQRINGKAVLRTARAAQFARSGRVVCPGFKENIWID